MSDIYDDDYVEKIAHSIVRIFEDGGYEPAACMEAMAVVIAYYFTHDLEDPLLGLRNMRRFFAMSMNAAEKALGDVENSRQ